MDIDNFQNISIKNNHFTPTATIDQRQFYSQQQQQQQLPLLNTFSLANADLFNVRPNFYSNTKTINKNGPLPGIEFNIDKGIFGIRLYFESEISVLQNLGKSKYGDILLCNIPSDKSKHPLAIVQTLNELAFKNEFMKLIKYRHYTLMKNENFAGLLGIIETPNYFASVIEHGDFDLNYFLRKFNTNTSNNDNTLRYVSNVLISTSISISTTIHTHIISVSFPCSRFFSLKAPFTNYIYG